MVGWKGSGLKQRSASVYICVSSNSNIYLRKLRVTKTYLKSSHDDKCLAFCNSNHVLSSFQASKMSLSVM